MRIVRVLVYEGPEEELRDHLSRTVLNEGVVKPFGQSTVSEVFRGVLSEPGKVTFMDRHEKGKGSDVPGPESAA